MLRALGWLLAVLGGLWVVLAGGCTLIFTVVSLAEMGHGQTGGLNLIPMMLFFGLFCIAPGALVLWGGLAILKSQRRLEGR